MHPYIYTIHVKFTDVSNEVSRQEKHCQVSGYSSYACIHAHAFSKINLPADVGIEVSRWGEKQVTLVMHP